MKFDKNNTAVVMIDPQNESESESGIHRAFRRDLEGAKGVQEAFFPPQGLCIPNLACATFYQPAHEIGGDYYDLLPLQGGRWGVAIGDVSGKGIGAALIMARLHASVRAQALHSHQELSALVGDVNRLVFESSPTHLFASLFYAEYDPATLTLKYVNAGHNPPLLLRAFDGSYKMHRLKATSIPVGMAAESRFASRKIRLQMGDILVAYTDGITETKNQKGDLWEQHRLESFLLQWCGGKTPEEIIEGILERAAAFAGEQPQFDDMTLMVMRLQETACA
jgi:phosphoserine phosphatase RsbU/P